MLLSEAIDVKLVNTLSCLSMSTFSRVGFILKSNHFSKLTHFTRTDIIFVFMFADSPLMIFWAARIEFYKSPKHCKY